jgi:hypothetical protein
LCYPILSFENVAWTSGIFLIVGLLLYYIIRKTVSIFANKDK